LLGPVAVGLAATGQPRWLFAPLLVIGMLSDIFDGVLARRFGVARPWLRRFDSATDIAYYLCIFAATWFAARGTVMDSILPLALLGVSEVFCIVVSFIRFGAMPATHTYAAKIYGLAIFAAFFAVLPFHFGAWVFWLLAGFGLIANLEIVIILALSHSAPVDVLSIFHLNRQTL
jgi:CDP-diacylglycerol--glycerol-3-phosphate 3-phosphatidyltransferase